MGHSMCASACDPLFASLFSKVRRIPVKEHGKESNQHLGSRLTIAYAVPGPLQGKQRPPAEVAEEYESLEEVPA